MRLERISLSGSHPLSVTIPRESPDHAGSIVVVTGPNGSGKSLLTAALYAAFASAAERAALAEDLLALGVEGVDVEFRHGNWMAVRRWEIRSEKIAVNWQCPLDAPQDPAADPPRFDPSEMCPRLHIIRSGQTEFMPDPAVRAALIRIARLPLERELAGWTEREAAMLGTERLPGRLPLAKSELQQAQAELDRLEQVWIEIEMLRKRQSELHAELTDAAAQHQILVAEADEVVRLCATAERCSRLEAWVAEIGSQLLEVHTLREQYTRRQTRLEELEDRFRDAPENLPGMLERRRELLNDEHALIEQIEHLAAERKRLADERRTASAQLQMLQTPAVADDERRLAELRRQAETVGAHLTHRLRSRIELVRVAEGARQQMDRDFPAFRAMDDAERLALEACLREAETETTCDPEPSEHDRRLIQNDAELSEIEYVLQKEFTGFDTLPATAPQQLRELHDLRNLRQVLNEDLENLRRRVILLRRKAHPVRSMIWCAVAGVAVFGICALWLAWDIAVLGGLAGSGLVMLLFRHIYRDVMADLESGSAAEVLTQQRLHETEEGIARLAILLEPLAAAANLNSARLRFAEYRRLLERRTQLLAAREKIAAAPAPLPPRISPPERFAAVNIPDLRQQYAAFRECEDRLAELAEQGSRYAEGGIAAREIRELEQQTARIKEQIAAAESAIAEKTETAAARRRELTARIDELEQTLTDDSHVTLLNKRLDVIRAELEAVERQAGLSDHEDAERLAAEWTERDDVRSALREIRARLSTHQTSDELRAREALLNEELAEVRQKIDMLDPLYLLDGSAADYVAKYQQQLLAAQTAIRENEETQRRIETEMNQLHPAELEKTLTDQPALPDLRATVETCRARVGEMERELATTRELTASIRSELADADAAVAQEFAAALQRRIRQLTFDRYCAIEPAGNDWTIRRADGAALKLRVLSDGSRDLIALAVRLAALDAISRYDGSPLVWDEALLRLDAQHQDRLRQVLERCAADRQVILLTRQPALEAWGCRISLSAEHRHSADIPS